MKFFWFLFVAVPVTVPFIIVWIWCVLHLLINLSWIFVSTLMLMFLRDMLIVKVYCTGTHCLWCGRDAVRLNLSLELDTTPRLGGITGCRINSSCRGVTGRATFRKWKAIASSFSLSFLSHLLPGWLMHSTLTVSEVFIFGRCLHWTFSVILWAHKKFYCSALKL